MREYEEATTIEVIILVDLGMTILVKEKTNLGLKIFILSVVKKHLDLLNINFLVKREEVVV